MLKKISCESITTKNCKFQLTGEENNKIISNFLIHYNEIHDPKFVAKCKDDLVIEYQVFLEKLSQLLIN